MRPAIALLLAPILPACVCLGQTPAAQAVSLAPAAEIANDAVHEDFPALCVAADGTPWNAYVEHDGKADQLKVAQRAEDKLVEVGVAAGPGTMHRPAMACDGTGAVWVVWSELLRPGFWQLRARAIRNGKLADNVVDVDSASGSAVFADAGTDADGRLTDWDKYGTIDNTVENVVEIYQGARVSYEGVGTPQPAVGFPKEPGKGRPQPQSLGKHAKGLYQNALKNRYKLGVFTNSDHIATNTSFGGVYTEDFTRKGVIAAINARRTIAGTDKIFMELSCNGRLLGEAFETAEKPVLNVTVAGTAPLDAVSLIRNEAVVYEFRTEGKQTVSTTFRDEVPIKGENRYYLRVQQIDGNMGWTSPVWATYTGE